VAEVIDGAFETGMIQSLYASYAALVEPYATTEVDGYSFLNSSSEFALTVSQLQVHAAARAAACSTYLGR
jgi:spore coat protein H